jgi:hypothetical protein
MTEKMQSIPLETMNLFMKFGDMMSEIINSERFYETNLRDISYEVSNLYFKLVKDMFQNKSVSNCNYQLQLLEFRLHEKICNDIIDKSSSLAKELEHLWFVDTSELAVAMQTARQQLSLAKNDLDKEERVSGCISATKGTVDNTYKVYSDFKARRGNLERKAKTKWLGALGGVFGLFSLAYYPTLSFLQKLDNPDFVIGVPAAVVVVLFMVYVKVFYQEPESP